MARKVHFITHSSYGPDKPLTHEVSELYHVEENSSKVCNVADQHPDLFSSIRRAVAKHRATVKDVPNQLEGFVEGAK